MSLVCLAVCRGCSLWLHMAIMIKQYFRGHLENYLEGENSNGICDLMSPVRLLI